VLDLKFIRQHPDVVKDGARKKRIACDVDRILALDEECRAAGREVDLEDLGLAEVTPVVEHKHAARGHDRGLVLIGEDARQGPHHPFGARIDDHHRIGPQQGQQQMPALECGMDALGAAIQDRDRVGVKDVPRAQGVLKQRAVG